MTEEDPFSTENAPGLSLVVLMRIYDVLLGIYTEQNSEKAAILMQIHEEGGIVGSLPHLNLGEE